MVALESSTRRDAVVLSDDLDAVLVEPEGVHPAPDRRGVGPERAGECASGEDVLHDVRGREPRLLEVGDGGQLEGAVAAVIQECAVGEDAVHDAEIARSGHAEVEADGTSPSVTSASSTISRVASSALL